MKEEEKKDEKEGLRVEMRNMRITSRFPRAFGGKNGTCCAGPNQLSLGTCSGDEPKIEEAVFLILLCIA